MFQSCWEGQFLAYRESRERRAGGCRRDSQLLRHDLNGRALESEDETAGRGRRIDLCQRPGCGREEGTPRRRKISLLRFGLTPSLSAHSFVRGFTSSFNVSSSITAVFPPGTGVFFLVEIVPPEGESTLNYPGGVFFFFVTSPEVYYYFFFGSVSGTCRWVEEMKTPKLSLLNASRRHQIDSHKNSINSSEGRGFFSHRGGIHYPTHRGHHFFCFGNRSTAGGKPWSHATEIPARRGDRGGTPVSTVVHESRPSLVSVSYNTKLN